MLNTLSGKKSYIVATLAIVYAIAEFFTGNVDSNSAIEIIFGALGLVGLRNAIPSNNPDVMN